MPRLVLFSRSTQPLLAARRRHQSSNTSTRQFHASTARRDHAEVQNHYEALELPFTASAADIKRQFYSLSKRHHPDRNKGDPTSSSRFVRISEAYHVLGSPEKRSRYDRDLARQQNRSPHTHHHHQHHAASYTGPAGSRPPSGLSRRRTAFRGPPPSFYRNGAWGAQGAKRAAAGGYNDEHASSSSSSSSSTSDHHSHAGQSTSSSAGGDNTYTGAFYSDGGGGGFGPGQAERGWDNRIPHWDRVAHRRTQEGIAARLARRGRARGESVEEMKNGGGSWSLLINFFVVSGAIAVVASIPSLFNNKRKERVPGK